MSSVWYGVADGLSGSIEKPDYAFVLQLDQIGDSLRGRIGGSYRERTFPVRGVLVGSAFWLEWPDFRIQLRGEISADNLTGEWANANNPKPQWIGDVIAARARADGLGMSAVWSGTAYGLFSLPDLPRDYPFYLTVVPVGDSLLGTLDPVQEIPQQVHIRGPAATDSIRFRAGFVEFLGTVTDTMLSGIWRYPEGSPGVVVESTWVARRLARPGVRSAQAFRKPRGGP